MIGDTRIIGISDSLESSLRIRESVHCIYGGNGWGLHYKYVQTIRYSLVNIIIYRSSLFYKQKKYFFLETRATVPKTILTISLYDEMNVKQYLEP